MISGYSIYLLSGLVAVVVLTCITGLKVVPLPPTRSLRLYIVFRSLFGHLGLATLVWLWQRQLGLGIYLLISCAYEVLLLAYFSHFHFIPGNGAGFVRTQNSCRTQCFDRRWLPR